MQAETSSKDGLRQRCDHQPITIDLTIGGDTYGLRSCSYCDWTESVRHDELIDLTEVLTQLTARR